MEKKLTPIKAIRKKCMECKEGHYKQIKDCEKEECSLHVFRMGKNPNVKRNYTDEQRQQIRERLLASRSKK